MKLCFRLFGAVFLALYLLLPLTLAVVPGIAYAQTTGTAQGSGAPTPTCVMSAVPSSIPAGGSFTLKWSSTNATGGAIVGVGNVGPQGSINLLPSLSSNTTYTGSFTGPGGTANCQAKVSVYTSAAGATANTGDSSQTPTINGAASSFTNTPSTPGGLGTAAGGAVNNVTPTDPGNGIVPCGKSDIVRINGQVQQSDAPGCEACNLAELVSIMINFLIGLSIPIAAFLFAYAGILYFTSGATPGNIETAKKIFQNALIGFLIAITAWLVINTLLHALLDGGKAGFTNGNWFTVQCSSPGARTVTGDISQLLSSLPIVSTAQPSMPVLAICDNTGTCRNPQGNVINSSGSGISCDSSLGGCTDSNNRFVATIPQYSGDAAAAIAAYTGMPTNAGPDNGNLACAWAINNVLQSEGIPAVDGNNVQSMENALTQGGRGTPVDPSQAQVGDIVIQGNDGHVGICQNAGCTSVISNSSSAATFSWTSNVNFGSVNTVPQSVTSRIYHVNQ